MGRARVMPSVDVALAGAQTIGWRDPKTAALLWARFWRRRRASEGVASDRDRVCGGESRE